MKSSKEKKTPTPSSKTPIAKAAPGAVGQVPLGLGLTPPHVEMFMLMMEKYKIDKLEFGVLKLEKSQHVHPELSTATEPEEDEEAVLYHSSN